MSFGQFGDPTGDASTQLGRAQDPDVRAGAREFGSAWPTDMTQCAPWPGAMSSTLRASSKSRPVTAPPTLWVFTVRVTV